MYAYNGMHWCMKEEATHEDLKKLAERRERQDFEVTWLSPNEIEINSDGMISDYMGTASLVKDSHRIYEAGER